MQALKSFFGKENNRISQKETETVEQKEAQQIKLKESLPEEKLHNFLRSEKEEKKDDKVKKVITFASITGSAIGAIITLYGFAERILLTQAAEHIQHMTLIMLLAQATDLMNSGLNIMVFFAVGGILASIAYNFLKRNKEKKDKK